MLAADIGATLENVTRLGSNAGLVLRALENRAALAALELGEARDRVQLTLVCLALSAVLLLLTGVTVAFVVAAIFWDTPHRVLALAILGGVELLLGVGGVWYALRQWKRWQPLEHTRDQLAKDSACLREMFTRTP